MEPAAGGPSPELPDAARNDAALIAGGHQPDQLRRLVAVMDRLRSPGGCPWDAEQTHESLVTYLIEEAHELAEAIATGDRPAMREELGDLLLQVVFHARIAQEHATDPWTIDEVAVGIADKLIARHPHVFGADHAPTAEHVESTWLARKTAEKGRESVLDGIPGSLPALLLAAKTVHRASVGGVDVPPSDPVAADAAAEALAVVGTEEVGELLLALVAQARAAGVDAEWALREAVREYADRVRAVERDDSD